MCTHCSGCKLNVIDIFAKPIWDLNKYVMNNPFDLLNDRFNELDEKLKTLNTSAPNLPEIINRGELCRRLAISEPTAIRWEKNGSIPCFRIGSNVRYNWPNVVAALENRNVATNKFSTNKKKG